MNAAVHQPSHQARRHWRAWTPRIFAAAVSLMGLALIADGVYIKAKAELAQILLNRAWQHSLLRQEPVRPWSWMDTWPVAKLHVPRLDASAIVLNGVSGQAMAFGPGLMSSATTPGESGLAVVSAHRDTHFRFLKHIARGDLVEIQLIDGQTHRFEITDLKIVDADQSGLHTDHQTAKIALVTCWPFDAVRPGPKRFVAIGERIS